MQFWHFALRWIFQATFLLGLWSFYCKASKWGDPPLQGGMRQTLIRISWMHVRNYPHEWYAKLPIPATLFNPFVSRCEGFRHCRDVCVCRSSLRLRSSEATLAGNDFLLVILLRLLLFFLCLRGRVCRRSFVSVRAGSAFRAVPSHPLDAIRRVIERAVLYISARIFIPICALPTTVVETSLPIASPNTMLRVNRAERQQHKKREPTQH